MCDIDYRSRTDISRNVISLIIIQCDPMPQADTVFASRAVQASEAHCIVLWTIFLKQDMKLITFVTTHCIITLISIRI